MHVVESKSMHPLVKELIKTRYRKGVTQKELAKRMGVARGNVAKFESDMALGRVSPMLITFERYAHALGVKLILVDESVAQ